MIIPQYVTVQHSLTMPELRKIFSEILHLPEGGGREIERIRSDYGGREIVFDDQQLEKETSLSELPILTSGEHYAGLLEMAAYISTPEGHSQIEGHQVVGCKLMMIQGRPYYVAAGILIKQPVLYFLPAGINGKKVKWPTSTIFLKFKPV